MVYNDAFEIPQSGAVFTFGRSRFAGNEPSQFFIRNDPVVHIACGDEHTVLICEGGRAFAFGSNDSGQLGLGHSRPVDKPMCIKTVKPWRLQTAACGKSHTLMAATCGSVFSCGANAEGQLGLGDKESRHTPVKIELPFPEGCQIVALAAGCLHSALLTERGDLWTWGGNGDGQCGVDSSGKPLLIPTEVICTPNPGTVTSIACGYYHTAFTRADGVWTMGESDNGKLGREVNDGGGSPGLMALPETASLPIQVVAGGSHTIVLTDEGSVYGCGSNWCGQLGSGSDQELTSPSHIQLPCKVDQIASGEIHSAFVTENGEVYVCGDSRHGKLGRDGDSSRSPEVMTAVSQHWVKAVACGGCHTMVLAWPKEQPDSDVVLPPIKPRGSIVRAMTEEADDTGDIDPDEPTANGIEDLESVDDESGATQILQEDPTEDDDDNRHIEVIENGAVSKSESACNVQEIEKDEDSQKKMDAEPVIREEKQPSRVKKMVNVFRRKSKGTAAVVDSGAQTSSKACVIL